jgi:hypothetical protein
MDPEEIYPLATWNSDGTGITATEVAQRLKEAESLLKTDVKSDHILAARMIDAARRLHNIAFNNGVDPKYVSVLLAEAVYCALLDLAHANGIAADARQHCEKTLLRAGFYLSGIEILCGNPGENPAPSAWVDPFKVDLIDADRKALIAKMQRCLKGCGVSELPKSPGGDSVRASAESIGEIPVTPSPASGDDRNPNSLAHLSDEAKVIAAKHAIAAYGRNKQLPSASVSALFRELDGKAAGNKGAAPKHAWQGVKWVVVDDINRNDHSLSTEPLSRAIDQIWVRENSGSYADLVSSRAERLAEMVCRTEAAADG